MEQEHNMMPENEVQKPETLTENAVNETVNAQENESAKVENEKEQVEIPPIDFTNLSTADIVRQMQKLIEQTCLKISNTRTTARKSSTTFTNCTRTKRIP